MAILPCNLALVCLVWYPVHAWTSLTSLEKSTKLYAENLLAIYSKPALYDMAFGYRVYEEEVDFLFKIHRSITSDGAVPSRILEVAAGPARHSWTAIESLYEQADGISPEDIHISCIDNSQEMRQYSLSLKSEYQVPDNAQLDYHLDDMRTFSLDKKDFYDTAWVLLGSLQHLTCNDDVISCLKAIHGSLKPGGTLILELPHPRELFSIVDCTTNGWEIPLEDADGTESGKLKIIWGDESDEFDPLTQVREMSVRFHLSGTQGSGDEAGLQDCEDTVPTRLFTAQEIDLVAYCAGFKVVSRYGALQDDVDINDEDTSYRMICALVKT